MEDNSRHDTESSTTGTIVRDTLRQNFIETPIVLCTQDRPSFPVCLFNQLQRLVLARLARLIIETILAEELNDE